MRAIEKNGAFILTDPDNKIFYPRFFANKQLTIPPKYVRVKQLEPNDKKMLARYTTAMSIAAHGEERCSLTECLRCRATCSKSGVMCRECEFSKYCSRQCMLADKERHKQNDCTGMSALHLIESKVVWEYDPYYDMCHVDELSGQGFAYKELHTSNEIRLAFDKRGMEEAGLVILDYSEAAHPHMAYVFFKFDACHKVTLVYPLGLRPTTRFELQFAKRHAKFFRTAGKAHTCLIDKIKETQRTILGCRDTPGVATADYMVYKAGHNGYPYCSPAGCKPDCALPATQASHNLASFSLKRREAVMRAVGWRRFKRRVYITVVWRSICQINKKKLLSSGLRAMRQWRHLKCVAMRSLSSVGLAVRHFASNLYTRRYSCMNTWILSCKANRWKSYSIALASALPSVSALRKWRGEALANRQSRQTMRVGGQARKRQYLAKLEPVFAHLRRYTTCANALHRYVARRVSPTHVGDASLIMNLRTEIARLNERLEAEQWRSYWSLMHVKDYTERMTHEAYPAASTARMNAHPTQPCDYMMAHKK
jgi:hypothetical protein